MTTTPFDCLISKDWAKPATARVRNATTNLQQWKEAELATLEAVVRLLVRRGWVRRRTSQDKRNHRATSRYLKSETHPEYEIRLSNHFLHDMNHSWKQEYVIKSDIMIAYNVLGIIAWIERDLRAYVKKKSS
jgi:hypothetical protein